MKKIAMALVLCLLTGIFSSTIVLAATPESIPESQTELEQDISDTELLTGSVEEADTPSEQDGAQEEQEASIDELDGTLLKEAATQLDPQAKDALHQLLTEQEVFALVYLSDAYPVRDSASADGATVITVPSGQQVQILDVELSPEGNVWVHVSFSHQETPYQGFVQRENLAVSDERFLAWEAEYAVKSPDSYATASAYSDVNQFPASYHSSLTALKNAHPNWIFVKMDTGLQWNTVANNQMEPGRSLVPDSFDSSMKNGVYGQGWSYASEGALQYYLDPRNWLTEQSVFQFEQLTYNASYHSEGAVQSFLSRSFMKGTVPEDNRSYATLFYQTGQNLGVSPFHLASRAYQEQGVNGSAMVSGQYPGYEKLYNYYNIGASGNTTQAVMKSGLERARKEGWTTHARSIEGGANILSKNYIRRGQDTLYLQKFDVDASYDGLYWHQYMQNIAAPSLEAKGICSLYANANSLNSTFVFKIPVYNNMPSSASPHPSNKGIDEFVTRLYTICLGRNPDSNGFNDYVSKLKSKQESGAIVSFRFFFSDEFKRKNLSNKDFVRTLYLVFLDREPDTAGWNDWTNKLNSGFTRMGTVNRFVQSDEFVRLCGKYGITSGTIEQHLAPEDKIEGMTLFVARLYNKALGRTPDSDGLRDWCNRMQTQGQLPPDIAYGFIFSGEFKSKNLSNSDFVKNMYRTFLDREPDGPGFNDWVGQLDRGASREHVFRGFAYSNEFKEIARSFGISY